MFVGGWGWRRCWVRDEGCEGGWMRNNEVTAEWEERGRDVCGKWWVKRVKLQRLGTDREITFIFSRSKLVWLLTPRKAGEVVSSGPYKGSGEPGGSLLALVGGVSDGPLKPLINSLTDQAPSYFSSVTKINIIVIFFVLSRSRKPTILMKESIKKFEKS